LKKREDDKGDDVCPYVFDENRDDEDDDDDDDDA
jgi:hypothetical protein